jgi:hypothetical protein
MDLEINQHKEIILLEIIKWNHLEGSSIQTYQDKAIQEESVEVN